MQQRSAHENPVIFYSMAIGFLGKSPTQPPNIKLFQLVALRTFPEDRWAMRYIRRLMGYYGSRLTNQAQQWSLQYHQLGNHSDGNQQRGYQLLSLVSPSPVWLDKYVS